MWFPNRSDTNQARSLKFRIYKVEELYYPCSENKGADQLRSYCEADLRLCFRLCRLLVFPCDGSFICLAQEMECGLTGGLGQRVVILVDRASSTGNDLVIIHRHLVVVMSVMETVRKIELA